LFAQAFRKEMTMDEYYRTRGFRQDKEHFLKALLLISKNIESLTNEVVALREQLSLQNNDKNSSE
jgi:hypothetical protein